MATRSPAVAGRFYEGTEKGCVEQLEQLIPKMLPASVENNSHIIAGVVPHAGWAFSGDVAGKVFRTIKDIQPVDTFIILGAIHVMHTQMGHLYDQGQWETPLGSIEIDSELSAEILAKTSQWVKADCGVHDREHSIEVEVPFIQHLFEEVKIVPLMLPAIPAAVSVGEVIADIIHTSDKKIVLLASTDLTHYGPSYGFTHMGTGGEALRWAKETNDQYFIDLTISMQADQIVETAQMYNNACGAGAVAATVAAAKKLGAQQGTLLAHTTSAEVLAEKYHQATHDSVGYAGIVFS